MLLYYIMHTNIHVKKNLLNGGRGQQPQRKFMELPYVEAPLPACILLNMGQNQKQ